MSVKNKTSHTPEMRNVILVRAAQVRALLVACINTSATPTTLAEMLGLPDSKLQATGMTNDGINNQLRGLVKDGLIVGTKRGVAVEYWNARKGSTKPAAAAPLKSHQKSALAGSSEFNKLINKRDAFNAEIDKKITLLRIQTIEEIVSTMQIYGITISEISQSATAEPS